MDIAIIAAVSENNVIGIENRIPWKIPEDMGHFKDLTIGHPVIMGRRTYESISGKFRPLKDRKNIVLSSTLGSGDGIHVARTIEEALELTNGEDSYVMGGERVYRDFLPLVNRMELTRVHETCDGDAFFPEVDLNDWKLVDDIRDITSLGVEYSFLSYVRRNQQI